MSSSRKRRPIAVLDTNVWVSALIWGGPPAEVVKAAERGEARVIASAEIVGEISKTLAYPKLERLALSEEVRGRWMGRLGAVEEVRRMRKHQRGY